MIDKVLLVEDDPIAVLLCKNVVRNTEFAAEIDVAQDGKLALDYYNELLSDKEKGRVQNYPKLVLLDLNMPVMGGWEFLDEFMAKFYAQCKETRVVILSSSIVPEDRERAGNYPVVLEFLSKPIRKEHLADLKTRLNGKH
jgi:CheY-like chemotaxis protein